MQINVFNLQTVVIIQLILCLLCLSMKAQDAHIHPKSYEIGQEEVPERQERLTIIAPKYLKPQSDYRVLVNLANNEGPVLISLRLFKDESSRKELRKLESLFEVASKAETFNFKIEDWPLADYVLNVSARASDGSWNFTREAKLNYETKSFSALIQTDKAIYKPGQVVQFRTIFLTQDLKPFVMKDCINVTVRNTNRIITNQWTSLSNWHGVLNLDLQLSDDSVLGDWSIKIEAGNREVVKKFQIAEYVLPTYEVSIQLPKYATSNESEIVATVKAAYTYGRPVDGDLVLTVKTLLDRQMTVVSGQFKELTTEYRAKLVKGLASIELDLKNNLRHDLYKECEIEFLASVEENLTGRKSSKIEVMKVYDNTIKIETLNNVIMYHPGLSYLLRLKVAYQDDTPVEDNGSELELRLIGPNKRVFNKVNLRPISGIVEHLFEVPKTAENEFMHSRQDFLAYITIEVTYRDHVHKLDGLRAFYTKSVQYLQISLPSLGVHSKQNKPLVSINDVLRVHLKATEAMKQVNCLLVARGSIIKTLSLDALNQTQYEFELTVEQQMVPKVRIVCFYTRDQDREIIADFLDFSVKKTALEILELKTSMVNVEPGSQVELDIRTKPDSLVGIMGIDLSSLQLGSGNDIDVRDLIRSSQSYGSYPNDNDAFCKQARNSQSLFNHADMIVLTNNIIFDSGRYVPLKCANIDSPFRTKIEKKLVIRSSYYRRNLSADESDLLPTPTSDMALNLPVVARDHSPALPEIEHHPVTNRSFFPETWFWKNTWVTSEDGRVQFKFKVPDTYTSWTFSVFSLNEESGIKFLKYPSSVRVFRPFFIKLNLPYSIVRGETVNIQAIIFNYSKRPVTAKVSLDNPNGDFEFVEAANNIETERRSSKESDSRTITVPPQDAVSVSFLITPKKLGYIDIKVTAQSELVGDGVVRKLLVKAEGQTQHLNKAMLISLAGGESTISRNFSIDVPANAVEGSRKVFVSAVGDLLGAGLSNMDDLLEKPRGCSEEIMVDFAPNILVSTYLKNSGTLRKVLKERAVENSEIGYKGLLNCKRIDGSFSAFGGEDNYGCVWLTAHVLKTLKLAQPFIKVDERVIEDAADLIVNYSKIDGRIEEVGNLLMKNLASATKSPAYLTAFALIALLQHRETLEKKTKVHDAIERGLDYLERRQEAAMADEDPYELALIVYTLDLADRGEPTTRGYEQLWSRSNFDGELVWWQSREVQRDIQSGSRFELQIFYPQIYSDVGGSLSIETTALALLTTVRRGELERALPIARWLISKQNSNGGFASTQDTVLAIEALASFAEASAVSKAPQSIHINLLYPRQQASQIRRTSADELLITQSNALVNQQVRLPDDLTEIQVEATGTGEAVLKVSWQYNLLESDEEIYFYLNTILEKTSNDGHLQLNVCSSYQNPTKVYSRAVLEVEFPLGFKVAVGTLDGLKNMPNIERIETADNKVVIYFKKLTRDEVCLIIPVHESIKVSNRKPVPVTIYDYYSRYQARRVFYEPDPVSSRDTRRRDTCSKSCSKSTSGRK